MEEKKGMFYKNMHVFGMVGVIVQLWGVDNFFPLKLLNITYLGLLEIANRLLAKVFTQNLDIYRMSKL